MRFQVWKQLVGSLVGDERIINLQSAKVCVFSDSVLCLVKIHQIPESNDISCGTKDNEEGLANAQLVSLFAKRFGAGQRSFIGLGSEKKWYSIKEDSPQGIWDHIAEKMLLEFTESLCPIFRATTPLSRGRLESKGHGKLSIHHSADLETIKTFRKITSVKSAQFFTRRNLVLDNGHLLNPGSEKKWYSAEENSPQGAWDHIADEMLLEFAESGHPIFRATTPLSRGKLGNKGHGKLSIHFAASQATVGTVFRIIVSANQLSLYREVANMCEEYESLHERTVRPFVMEQSSSSLVLSAIRTEVPLENDDPSVSRSSITAIWSTN